MELISSSWKSSEILYSSDSIHSDEMEAYTLNKNPGIYTPLSAAPKMKILGNDESIIKNTINKPSLLTF